LVSPLIVERSMADSWRNVKGQTIERKKKIDQLDASQNVQDNGIVKFCPCMAFEIQTTH
jgi:hypothetical protein